VRNYHGTKRNHAVALAGAVDASVITTAWMCSKPSFYELVSSAGHDTWKRRAGRLRFEKRTEPAAALAAKEILHRHRSLLAFWKYLDKNGKDDDRGAPYRGGVIREAVSQDPDFTKHRMLRYNLAENELLHDLGLDDPRQGKRGEPLPQDEQLRKLREIPLSGWGRDIEPAPMMS
jgi:hypothetical protein